jgi:hypothetical protein
MVGKEGRKQVLVKTIGTVCTEAACNKLQVLARQTLSELMKQGRQKFNYPDYEWFVKQPQINIQSVRIAEAGLIPGIYSRKLVLIRFPIRYFETWYYVAPFIRAVNFGQ